MLKNDLNNSFVKTIKFKEIPHPTELIDQLKLYIQNFGTIVNRPADLTIRLIEKDWLSNK